MRILLATLGLIACFTATASAQGPCLVTQPGLSFEQWYQICAAQVAQMCQMVPMPGAACVQSSAQAEYQTYVQSQFVSMARSVPGHSACINGYVATCNGTLFMTSAQHC
jgi:hypothetical protein